MSKNFQVFFRCVQVSSGVCSGKHFKLYLDCGTEMSSSKRQSETFRESGGYSQSICKDEVLYRYIETTFTMYKDTIVVASYKRVNFITH